MLKTGEGLLQDRPDPKTAILLLRGICQDLAGSKRRGHLVIAEHVAECNRVRSRRDPRGVNSLENLEILHYMGKLLAEPLDVSFVKPQPGKKGNVPHFFLAYPSQTGTSNAAHEGKILRVIIPSTMHAGNVCPRVTGGI